jgi:glycosyltransferase involved in cell wall biosynthesis
MRILAGVGGGTGSRISGPEIRGWALARALGERHDVTVAVHEPGPRELDGHRLVPFTRRRMVREARRHDAVIAPAIPPYLYAALRGSSTIAVADQYDPVALELSVFTDQPGIARELEARRLIREVQLRFADVIVCAGAAQRELLLGELDALSRRRAAPPTVVNVPFGLGEPPPPSAARPLRAAIPQIGPEDPVVLWWGKVWKWFDARTALEAFALVVERRPDARLVISAGKAPNAKFDLSETTEEARALSRQLGLLDRSVFFLDEWTPYDRRHEYIDDADIGLTLHADSPEAPFAARARYLDYLWCALPCVLARGDEVAERFADAGFAHVVPPGDREATAAAILRLIEQPEARAAARQAGRRLADEYRWQRLVEPLAQAIEERAASPAGASADGLAPVIGHYYMRRTVDQAASLARALPR